MPFPTLGFNGGAPLNLSTAWEQARTVAGFVKGQSKNLMDRSATQSIGATEILTYVDQIASWRAQLASLGGMSGIAAYAQQMLANPTEDIVAEFNAMTAQIDATITLIVTTFPVDAQGRLLATRWQGVNTGRTVDVLFSTTDLANLRTQLAALIATMN